MRNFKRASALLLALALTFGLAVPAFAAGEETQRGVLTYTEPIAAQYDDAGLFIDGLAPVKKDGKWGFIDKNGNVAIDFQYDYAWRFNEGYAMVAKAVSFTPSGFSEYITYDFRYYMEAEIGFVDAEGKYTTLINPAASYDNDQRPVPGPLTLTFHDVTIDYGDGDVYTSRFLPEEETWLFHQGVVLFRDVDPESGYPTQRTFKTDGTEVRPEENGYSFGNPTGPMNEGLIPIVSGECGGYMDINGKPFLFEEEEFGPEITTDWGTLRNSRWICSVNTFNQGLALATQAVYDAATHETTYLTGFIDKDYNWVIEPQFNYWYWQDTYRTCQVFGETGLASVAKADRKWGAIDKTGAVVIPFQYEQLGVVGCGLQMFAQDGKYGYLDAETHEAAIPAQYAAASSFSSSLGLAAVYDGKNAFLIDRNGSAVPGADSLDPSTYFIRKDDGSYQTYTPDQYVIVKHNGKYGYGKIDYLPELPSEGDTTAWAYSEVVEAIESDLVPVSLQNLYRQDITRGEFCDLIVQTVSEVLGKDVETLVLERTGKTLAALRKESSFNDTVSTNVAAAFALGIVNGMSDTTFKPYGQIKRQEAAAMLARAARLLELEPGAGIQFNDAGSFASWAKDEIDYVSGLVDPVTNNRVMNGVSIDRFSPTGTYTREQAISTTLRLFHCAAE